MKKIFFYLFILNSFYDLKVNAQTSSNAPLASYINGGWRWVKSCGGIAGWCKDPSTEGFTRGLFFSASLIQSDSIAYKCIKNNTMLVNSFSKINSSITGNDTTWKLVNLNVEGFGVQTMIVFKKRADTLWIKDLAMDGYLHRYVRDQTVVGVEERMKEKISFNIFPNPVSDKMKIEVGSEDTFSLVLCDLNGKILISEKNISVINCGSLPPGVYFVNVKTEKGSVFQKIIKE